MELPHFIQVEDDEACLGPVTNFFIYHPGAFFSWEGVDNDDRANTNVNASFPLLNVLLSFTEIYRISPFLTEFLCHWGHNKR